MLKKDLLKHHHLNIEKSVIDFSKLIMTNVLLKEYLQIDYQVKVTNLYDSNEFLSEGTIDYQVKALDARDGNEFVHQGEIDWVENYLLSDFSDDLIDFDKLAAEQINLNIPINLSYNRGTINKVGPGWELLSEDEFDQQIQQTSDPRWDKLKELK